jgi:hypothetical protein
MEETMEINVREFKQLVRDVAVLKNLLLEEGELSEWAKKELKESREISVSHCISQNDLKKELLQE